MGDKALRGNKLTAGRTGKSIGGILKGIGKAVFKKKPKPSKANNWKGESMFDWVDRKDAEDAIAGGWPAPTIKPGKIAKNIVRAGKVGVAAIPASYAYGKWKRHLKKKKKRTKKAAGSIVKSVGKILKGPANKWRMDQAQRLKDYHRKTKIKKRKAGRIEEGKSKAFHKKYIKPMSPEAKASWSKGQHPKSWKRQGKGLGGILKGIGKGIGKRITGSHKIKKGGWQDMKRPKDPYYETKKPDWEFKADREELADIDRKIKATKNVGKGVAGALVGSYAYGKWKQHKRAKKKKDKDKDKD